MQDINDILAKHFAGETNPEEEAKVNSWKSENEDEYAMLKMIWLEDPKIEFKSYDHQSAWNKIDHLIEEKAATKTFTLKTFVKYAAAACMAALIGWGAHWYFSAEDMLTRTNETEIAMEVNMPDGSQIWLAPGAEIEYPVSFADNRSVELHGEAFFDVERDEEHPFIVSTEPGEIEVLGTSFNIDAKDNEAEVSVESGLVAVRNDEKEVKITVGESVILTENNISEIHLADANFKSWQTGVFKFENTPLKEVVIELNKYFKEEIVIENEAAKSIPITANFENQGIDEIIEIIILTCDLRSEKNGDKIILK